MAAQKDVIGEILEKWRIAELNAEIAWRLKEATKAGPGLNHDLRIQELRAERDRLVS